MEINYRNLMVGGVLLLMLPFLAAILFYYTELPSIIFGIIFVIGFFGGLILLCYGMIKYYKLKSKGLKSEDERTKRINYKTMYYTSIITMVLVIFLFSLAQQKIIPLPNNLIILIILFLFGFTSLFFRWYLNKKSDL